MRREFITNDNGTKKEVGNILTLIKEPNDLKLCIYRVKSRKKFLKKEKQGRTKKTQLAYLGTKAHSNHEPINQLVRFLELISI